MGFAYEFDGDNRASKQLHTVRGEDPESGIYTVTTPTYYLHSTVLGQVVAELDAQGNKMTSHIYVQGMCLASDLGGGYPSAVVQWEYTDPVTGSKGASNLVPENWVMTELSTLGADVTDPPPPPEAETYQAPIYIEPVKQTYYQIEGGPSDSYGVDSWYTNMVNKDFDRHMAEVYWKHGFRDWAMAIVANNPNVGVLSRHYDRNGNLTNTGLRWGAQAAGFLMGISHDLETGRLTDANSEAYGEVIGYELDSPQNSVTEDNPNELHADNNGSDCGVVVNFKPRTSNKASGLPNGPSTITYNGAPNFGLGFSVSGWVVSGGIGTIGVDAGTGKKVPNPANPKGRWSLEQWTHSWIGKNGKTMIERKTFPDLPLNAAGLTAQGNTFGYYDHPGGPPPSPGFARYDNYLIKVYAGNTVCEVGFHLIQIESKIRWGRGLR